jgi:dTDP-4-amino-4,6-dideoxygalactose transaminase
VRLFAALGDLKWIRPASVKPYVEHAYFWAPFAIDTELVGMSGKEVWEHLKEYGVETRHRYTDPLYDQPVFTEHRGFNSEFPWSANEHDHDYDLSLETVENVVGDVIGLPNHPTLSDEEVSFVVDRVRQFGEDHADN